MIKLLIASGVAVSAAALASPASAGSLYLNPEFNTSIGSDTGVGGAILEGSHWLLSSTMVPISRWVLPRLSLILGRWKRLAAISGKAGMSSGPLYGELSFITGDETTVGNQSWQQVQLLSYNKLRFLTQTGRKLPFLQSAGAFCFIRSFPCKKSATFWAFLAS